MISLNTSSKFLLRLCIFTLIFTIVLKVSQSSEIRLKAKTIETQYEPQFDYQQYKELKTNNFNRLLSIASYEGFSWENSFVHNQRNTETKYSRVLTQMTTPSEKPLVLVKLDGTQHFKDVQNAWDVSLGAERVGNHSFITQLPLHKLSESHRVPGVEWVGHFQPSLKTTLHFNHNHQQTTRNHSRMVNFVAVLSPASELSEHRQAFLQVNQLFQGHVSATVHSSRRASISCRAGIADTVVSTISQLENVVWIELSYPLKQMNKYAHSLVQTGIQDSNQDRETPIWNQGIKGNGERIGILDTGLDWDNCLLKNPSGNKPPINIARSNYKISGYFYVNDDAPVSDIVNGHGTHVAGIAAGNFTPYTDSSPNSLRDYNGVAPEASVTMFAIGDSEGNLKPPYDLGSVFDMTNLDHIYLLPWGTDMSELIDCEYDCNCVWGEEADAFGFIPGDPVNDEWCQDQLHASCCYASTVYNIWSNEIDSVSDTTMVVPAGNGGTRSSRSSITQQAVSKNAIIVGSSNTVSNNFQSAYKFIDLLEKAKKNGYDTVEACCSAGINECCEAYWRHTAFNNTEQYQASSLSDFSARGPSADGRIVPDVVAPGHTVISAHSDGIRNSQQCSMASPRLGNSASLLAMSGTSMAAANVAGSLALVSQYRYQRQSFKAILINSGQPLSQTVDGAGNTISLSETPNNYVGYGAVDLSSVLTFRDSNFSLFRDSGQYISVEEKYEVIITPERDGEIRATLTWEDPAVSPASSSQEILVFNFNFRVGNKTDQSRSQNAKRLSVPVSAGEEVPIVVTRSGSETTFFSLVVTYPGPPSSRPSPSSSSSDISNDLNGAPANFLNTFVFMLNLVWPLLIIERV
eukprot:gb/GECH01002887.1/.p1 GENE.gb/GECH01002887.1/~~gb/GECH01002887.1/.p1  ORF type:complete len:859 (+),score=181.45 gb/GECH01002887.1/:1-2577(+)